MRVGQVAGECHEALARIERPQDAGDVINEAFRQMLSGRPGPVAVEMAWDTMAVLMAAAVVTPSFIVTVSVVPSNVAVSGTPASSCSNLISMPLYRAPLALTLPCTSVPTASGSRAAVKRQSAPHAVTAVTTAVASVNPLWMKILSVLVVAS